ncbi:hypothetical protein BASA81_016910 [Batrachochytrium salamandrivorans]|nr:hypothetical protein BASA81_016910 [Batrachochytrium salamandrivorans]
MFSGIGSSTSSGNSTGSFIARAHVGYILGERFRAPKNPVVLCHGLFGYDRLGPQSVPFLQLQYWRGIHDALVDLGCNSEPYSHLWTHPLLQISHEIIARHSIKPPLMIQTFYSSYAAVTKVGKLAPLNFSYQIINRLEGDNDGLVSLKSAQWGEFMGTVDCDHWDLVPPKVRGLASAISGKRLIQ